MKQQEVFKRIGIIIKEINQQYDYLSETEGKLNDLELELFVANAHFLADHSEVLSKLNLQPVPPAEKPKTSYEEKYFEPLVQQVKPVAEIKPVVEEAGPVNTSAKTVEAELTNTETDEGSSHSIDLQGGGGSTDDSFSFIRQEPQIIKHELILDESEDWDDDDDEGFQSDDLTEIEDEPEIETPVVEVKEPEVVKDPEPIAPLVEKAPEPIVPVVERIPEPAVESEPVVEKAPEPIKEAKIPAIAIIQESEEPLTINQRMSAQLNPGNRASEHMNTQVITDLKQAINLNDKLLYVRDLFNGYSLAYSEVIDILNRFSSFEEADKFLKTNYAVKNNWESKQATVDKFYGLLRRRYL